MSPHDFKRGDEVIIFQKIIPDNWANSWTDAMDQYVGKTGIVTDIYAHGIFTSVTDAYSFPPEALTFSDGEE